MKKDIHPKYNDKIKAICACGFVMETGSVESEIKTELCSNCHPFYTGKQKLVDTANRVGKFKAKLEKKDDSKKSKTTKRAEKSQKKADKNQ
ncbi:MAG TPA: 50S ribosomal protein L31 [bacterium]|nr:50S ribosomal protein L31 [bacterium]